ncbi:hypothetical protein TNCV_3881881 [Trichonephila clavipes]|nr:hypothetical protein TNCV_3881881 [Trichonephila clavipes]
MVFDRKRGGHGKESLVLESLNCFGVKKIEFGEIDAQAWSSNLQSERSDALTDYSSDEKVPTNNLLRQILKKTIKRLNKT